MGYKLGLALMAVLCACGSCEDPSVYDCCANVWCDAPVECPVRPTEDHACKLQVCGLLIGPDPPCDGEGLVLLQCEVAAGRCGAIFWERRCLP
jgi:hypothetical protein